MPHPTDTGVLRSRIHAYAGVVLQRDSAGKVLLSGAGDPVALICDEIGQTRLPRRLTISAGDVPCLDLWARNGRLMAVLDRRNATERLDCAAGTAADARRARDTIGVALAGYDAFSISYFRASDAADSDGPGLAADSILSDTTGGPPADATSTHGHVAGLVKDDAFHPTHGSEDDIDTLFEIISVIDLDMIFADADDADACYDQVTLATVDGQQLTFARSDDGILVSLSAAPS